MPHTTNPQLLLTTRRRLSPRRADRIRAHATAGRWLWLRVMHGVKRRPIPATSADLRAE